MPCGSGVSRAPHNMVVVFHFSIAGETRWVFPLIVTVCNVTCRCVAEQMFYQSLLVGAVGREGATVGGPVDAVGQVWVPIESSAEVGFQIGPCCRVSNFCLEVSGDGSLFAVQGGPSGRKVVCCGDWVRVLVEILEG